MPGDARRGDSGLRLLLGIPALAIGALSFASCGSQSEPRIDLGRPPIVVILLDALHAKHLSHFGYARPTTPNLDALAAEGFSFPLAFAPAPYTLATVPSILTGRLPDKHGLVEKDTTLSADEVTLAELLGEAGYRTCAAVGNLNGSSIFNCDQGFEEYVEVFRAEDGRSVDVVYGEDEYHFAKAVDFPPLVERFLAGDDGRPPFLYLHILEPHEPYAPPESYRSLYVDPEYAGPYAAGDSAMLIQGRRGERAFEPADKQAIEALYDANLTHVDAVVGRILAQLDAAGILDDTLIVVTSDHGEAFWQHGKQGHNTTLYDEMLHVPLIVRFPKGSGPALVADDSPAHARPAGLVSPMDLVPSLCDWLDLRLPASDLDGRSLTPALFGEPNMTRALRLRSHHADPWYALRTISTKTIIARGAPPRIEHFRLDQDPTESRDAVSEHEADVERDLERLRNFVTDAAQSRATRGMAISDSERAMLRGLGYVDDGE